MKYLMLLCALSMCVTLPAFAEESCDTSCADGKIAVSFADGNNVTCECMDPSDGMQDTVSQAADEPSYDQELAMQQHADE